ncbi:MAG: CsgG/HfaB family protein [Planctomycetaceae bacterium]|jgi:TolB-like protein|nr:CsgG/HfaB family protein [Planctomycetaceae bacterium]
MKKCLSFILIVFAVFANVNLSADVPTNTVSQVLDRKGNVVVYPVAVLPFQDRSQEVAGQGKIVADILFANLAANPSILLVDRENFETVLKEQELNLSGVVSSDQAVRVGNLIGAKMIVTGSVVRSDKTVYLIAKIIGTETTQVLGVSEKGLADDEINELAEKLAGKISETILKDAPKLVAKPLTQDNRINTLKEKIKDKTLPVIMIDIPEEHLSQRVVDPAAETEFSVFCTELGFTVLDKKTAEKSKANLLFVGEAFSERGMPIGNLVSVKARVELKAIDRETGKIIVIDRQTMVAVDLAETIAAKTALQQAAAALAERIIPKIVK